MRVSDWSSDVCSSDLHWASMSSVIGLAENLRMEMAVPRRDSGGTMTLTRLPSGRRASASGVVWSTRRPPLFTMRWAIWNRCSASRDLIGARSEERRVGKECVRPRGARWVLHHYQKTLKYHQSIKQ